MNADNDRNLLGRIAALALILGVAYGVHAISSGSFGCALGGGSCCGMEAPVGGVAEPSGEPAKTETEGKDSDGDERTAIPAAAAKSY